MGNRTDGREMKKYVTFFLLALALGIAPGPDVLFVFAQALSHGAMAGTWVTLGLCTGLTVHIALAAFGVAAILKRYPKFFTALTWCGAAYLVYLGILTLLHARTQAVAAADAGTMAQPVARLYLRGIIMNLCNPKVMLFFIALMPRFIVPERGRIALQFLFLGCLFILATLLVFNLVAISGGALSAWLATFPAASLYLQLISAAVMFGIAGWIAVLNLRGGHPS